MSFLNIFKKKSKKETGKKVKTDKKAEVKAVKEEKKAETKEAYSTLKPKVEGLETITAKPGTEKKTKKTKKEDTEDAYKILIRPLVTEKATHLVSQNKYSFEVSNRANKITVKQAIKSLYGINPLEVNIINMRGKKVSYGKVSGKKKNWKKAVITLKEGDKIEIYEGV